MISLGFIQQYFIISGDQINNNLTVNGNNNINGGNIGYTNIINNVGSSLINYIIDTVDYNSAILDLNTLISDIGNLTFTSFTNIDIGSISSITSPLSPGNYLFTNSVTFNTTLYLSGDGQYIFYFMSTLTINNPPTFGYINLSGNITSDDIFFYSPYDIIFNTSIVNSSIYGNFISDLNINDISTGNFNVTGRFLSSTGNIIIKNTSFLTNIVACYLEGSLVLVFNSLTNCQEYKKIEDICNEDKICIFGKVINNSNFKLCDMYYDNILFLGKKIIRNPDKTAYPICFSKNCLGENLPFEDLQISHQHRIIINNEFIIAKYIFHAKIIKYDYKDIKYFKKKQMIIYYHIECKEHSIIMVNGILTETLLDFNGLYKNKFNKIF